MEPANNLTRRFAAGITGPAATAGTRARATYRRFIFQHIIPVIGKLRFRDLRLSHGVRVLANARNQSRTKAHGKPFGSKTLDNLRTYLQMVGEYARKNKITTVNVFEDLDPITIEEIERPEITLEGVESILVAIAGTEIEAPVSVALATGDRLGQLAGWRWSDIDLTTGRYSIKRAAKIVDKQVIYGDTKGHQSRRGDVIPAFGLAVLESYREAQFEQLKPSRWKRNRGTPKAEGRLRLHAPRR